VAELERHFLEIFDAILRLLENCSKYLKYHKQDLKTSLKFSSFKNEIRKTSFNYIALISVHHKL